MCFYSMAENSVLLCVYKGNISDSILHPVSSIYPIEKLRQMLLSDPVSLTSRSFAGGFSCVLFTLGCFIGQC